jgi:mono/diheme cytochrome c family protein
MIDSLYQFVTKLGFPDPLHAPITHIPIGLVIGAFLFLVVGIVFSRKNMLTTARHVSILAFLFVFPTIMFGVFDWLHFFKGAMIPPIKMKMILASTLLVLLSIGIILGSEVKLHAAPMLVVYGLACVCVVGLGWYGARLVYGGFSAGAAQAAPASGGTSVVAAVPPGQRLFADNCASCHPNGGNVVVAELPIKTSKKLADLASFTSFIRSPRMPNGSSGDMPAFGTDQLSDKQAGELYTYISSAVSGWK